MKKTEFSEQVKFFSDEIRDYNCIIEIISSDDKNNSTIDALKKRINTVALKDYFRKPTEYQKFLNWCFMGALGKVDYILIHSYDRDENKVSGHTKIYGIKEYMNLVKKMTKDAGFGTGLTWTYKTVKTRGEKRNEIQLKVPLIY